MSYSETEEKLDTAINFVGENIDKMSYDVAFTCYNRISQLLYTLEDEKSSSSLTMDFSYLERQKNYNRVYLSNKAKKIEEKEMSDKLAEALAKKETIEFMVAEIKNRAIIARLQ